MRREFISAVPEREVVRVLVVDDQVLFAEALMLTLGIDDHIEVVGSASSGVEAVSLAEALLPDVVLMDVHMPTMDGIEAARRVRSVSPGSRVVIITAATLSEIAGPALAAGVECCLTKDIPALKLIDAVLDVPRAANVTPLVLREASVA
jgi:two-component system response regulator DesR